MQADCLGNGRALRENASDNRLHKDAKLFAAIQIYRS